MRIPRPRVAVATAAVLLATACSNSVDGAANGGSQPPPQDQAAPETAERTTTSGSTGEQDPSVSIEGIEIKKYTGGNHVQTPQRVAYDQSPPFGGAHDAIWAACNGVVYPKAVRTEHMVHALEHGAVWIAYNPDTLPAAGVQTLATKVDGVPYMVMSPYPGLDKPFSLQSWGHRLKLDDPADPRVDEFVKSLKQNKFTYPEPGATCDIPTSAFDQDDPPPFDPSPAPAGAAPVGD